MKQSVTKFIFFGGRFGGNTTLLVKKNADEKTHLPGYDLRNGGLGAPGKPGTIFPEAGESIGTTKKHQLHRYTKTNMTG